MIFIKVLALDLVKKVDHGEDQGLSPPCHLSPSNKINPTKYSNRQITPDKTTKTNPWVTFHLTRQQDEVCSENNEVNEEAERVLGES